MIFNCFPVSAVVALAAFTTGCASSSNHAKAVKVTTSRQQSALAIDEDEAQVAAAIIALTDLVNNSGAGIGGRKQAEAQKRGRFAVPYDRFLILIRAVSRGALMDSETLQNRHRAETNQAFRKTMFRGDTPLALRVNLIDR